MSTNLAINGEQFRERNPFEILGISKLIARLLPDEELLELIAKTRRAYQTQFHPDRQQTYQEFASIINSAYDELTDKTKFETYKNLYLTTNPEIERHRIKSMSLAKRVEQLEKEIQILKRENPRNEKEHELHFQRERHKLEQLLNEDGRYIKILRKLFLNEKDAPITHVFRKGREIRGKTVYHLPIPHKKADEEYQTQYLVTIFHNGRPSQSTYLWKGVSLANVKKNEGLRLPANTIIVGSIPENKIPKKAREGKEPYYNAIPLKKNDRLFNETYPTIVLSGYLVAYNPLSFEWKQLKQPTKFLVLGEIRNITEKNR